MDYISIKFLPQFLTLVLANAAFRKNQAWELWRKQNARNFFAVCDASAV